MSELKQLCLNMIVKNEATNLPILFASLHEVIDYYVICDTGSEDNTIQVIKDEMAKYNIPGEIHEHTWKNFGHNRQLSLQEAIGKAKYLLFIDGDETLEYTDKNFPKTLTHAGYNLEKRLNSSIYWVPHIINVEDNNKWGWEWAGVVHNYLNVANKNKYPGFSQPSMPNIMINAKCAGGKSVGVSPKEKYMRDANLLEEELKINPEDSRSMFYLGQSYKDADELEKSIECYKKRIQMGGWAEEVYYSYLMIAQQLKQLNKSGDQDEKIVSAYLDAYQAVPTRMEALYFLALFYQNKKKLNLSYMFGKIGAYLEKPESGLFIFGNICDYQLYDLFAVRAYWKGDYEESAFFCNKLIKEGKIPESSISRVKDNLKYCKEKLKQKAHTTRVSNIKKKLNK